MFVHRARAYMCARASYTLIFGRMFSKFDGDILCVASSCLDYVMFMSTHRAHVCVRLSWKNAPHIWLEYTMVHLKLLVLGTFHVHAPRARPLYCTFGHNSAKYLQLCPASDGQGPVYITIQNIWLRSTIIRRLRHMREKNNIIYRLCMSYI
jgi:hypothetical protein